jgi:hypothetical protein
VIYKGKKIPDYVEGQRVRSVDGAGGTVELVMLGMPPLVRVLWDDGVRNIWDADDPSIAPVEVIETSAPLVCDAELVGDRITVTFKSPARGARMVPMLELAQFIVLELAGKHPDVREIVARDSSGEQLQSYEREEEASYR